jgi:hypothetical protein
MKAVPRRDAAVAKKTARLRPVAHSHSSVHQEDFPDESLFMGPGPSFVIKADDGSSRREVSSAEAVEWIRTAFERNYTIQRELEWDGEGFQKFLRYISTMLKEGGAA